MTKKERYRLASRLALERLLQRRWAETLDDRVGMDDPDPLPALDERLIASYATYRRMAKERGWHHG